jgi:WhiB family transcriptional regulator, redox-sensing transcriptional regulator
MTTTIEQSSRAHNGHWRGLHPGPRVIPDTIGANPFQIVAYQEWMADANCLDSDPEIFYPNKGAKTKCRQAKQICDACPVKQQCLRYAVKRHEEWGIWGGLTATERRKATV